MTVGYFVFSDNSWRGFGLRISIWLSNGYRRVGRKRVSLSPSKAQAKNISSRGAYPLRRTLPGFRKPAADDLFAPVIVATIRMTEERRLGLGGITAGGGPLLHNRHLDNRTRQMRQTRGDPGREAIPPATKQEIQYRGATCEARVSPQDHLLGRRRTTSVQTKRAQTLPPPCCKHCLLR